MSRPLILVDSSPRPLESIFEPAVRAKLESLGEVVTHDQGRMPDDMVEKYLPDVVLIMGQTKLPRVRLEKAKKLRAIIDVETNFTDAIDYDYCFSNGIHVLTPGSAFADVVAESALGMAIDLARGITKADRDFRRGTEGYGLDGNHGSFSISGQKLGMIGYGDLARSFHKLVQPFHCEISVYDPWVPDYVLQRVGVKSASLEQVLSESRIILVFAGVTSENQGFLDRAKLSLIRPDAIFLLMSRAAVVDFPVFVEMVAAGKFRAATDVFPEEPVAKDDPVRKVEGLLLSAHRTGGMPSALFDIGRQAVADAELILKGLPPVVCRKALPETVKRFRSKPVEVT
ncbi:NAD(P)-dependent oxidoreductase [Aestuariivirga litoralis]|uniref:NAD(P)-dependent oxidoreductase n=1 Tax=Aestuariivirga litoralis TaxID=2650924 RepID=UPI0018C7DB88|nr:NAD(P)-dependent oxidoreductase [Aestuariivirga litoralis]MBG1232663.1 hydroxyacid dehydrogenase [Aestuariivirga litoralis]